MILHTYLAQLGELSEAQARLRSIKVKLDPDWAVSFVLALPRSIVRFLLSEEIRLRGNRTSCFVSVFRFLVFRYYNMKTLRLIIDP